MSQSAEFTPIRPRLRHKRRRSSAPPALKLVSAQYTSSTPMIRLVFDRPVDFSAFNAAQVTLTDGVSNSRAYVAQSPPSYSGDQKSITIHLTAGEAYTGSQVKLTATALNGIVAEDDGGAWPGATDLVLPFP